MGDGVLVLMLGAVVGAALAVIAVAYLVRLAIKLAVWFFVDVLDRR